MNASVVLFIISLLALIFLLSRVLKQKRPQAPLIRRLRESGVRVGDTEQLMAGGVFWERQAQLMTDREVHFMQGPDPDVVEAFPYGGTVALRRGYR